MLAALPDDSPFFAMGPRAVTPTAKLGNRADILMADIPAGGKMTARAMARLYAALLSEVNSVRLLSPERLREVTTLATTGNDELLGIPATWTLGYSTGAPGPRMETVRTLFGAGGVGGSFAYGDTARGIGFALAKNRLAADFETADRIAEIVTKAVAES
jgi:CubicO group peptidase (beta-lactamase class C family)